jgi:hypothetical protein
MIIELNVSYIRIDKRITTDEHLGYNVQVYTRDTGGLCKPT